jgi:2-C-methyl-D-erythritol 4-phosphate cytidylyltransferase
MPDNKQSKDFLYVIIPAAGQGRRMGGSTKKQFLPVGGVPVLARTLLAFSSFEKIMNKKQPFRIRCIVVTAEENLPEVQWLCEEFTPGLVEKTVAGGPTRRDSVWNGIQALSALNVPPKENDIVFIHDGARCLVDAGTLVRCLEGARMFGVCAAAVAVKDTIKQADSPVNGKVISTPDRTTLFAIQTPQAFLMKDLYLSYSEGIKNNQAATDDTSLAEAAGLPVHLVEGSYTNIKITTQEDLLFADVLQSLRKDGEP